VPAAGGAELQMARQLDNWAVDKELNSVQKLAISGFAFALRTVPATLAEVAAKNKVRGEEEEGQATLKIKLYISLKH
jgi:chaperonin GroEL (HSP60 family)